MNRNLEYNNADTSNSGDMLEYDVASKILFAINSDLCLTEQFAISSIFQMLGMLAEDDDCDNAYNEYDLNPLPHSTRNRIMNIANNAQSTITHPNKRGVIGREDFQTTHSLNLVISYETNDEEEARRRAEEEARRQAEEEARRQAEEEARRQAEEEARRQAEEEARRQMKDNNTGKDSGDRLDFLLGSLDTSNNKGWSVQGRLPIGGLLSVTGGLDGEGNVNLGIAASIGLPNIVDLSASSSLSTANGGSINESISGSVGSQYGTYSGNLSIKQIQQGFRDALEQSNAAIRSIYNMPN